MHSQLLRVLHHRSGCFCSVLAHVSVPRSGKLPLAGVLLRSLIKKK